MVQTKRFFHKVAFESCIMTRETIWQWHSSDNGAYKRESTLDLQQTTREPGGVAPRDSGFPPLWREGGGGSQLRPEVQLLTLFQIYTFFAPFTYLDSCASGRNSCPWLRLQGCYGCAIRKVLPYCGIDTCTSVLKLLFCSGSTLAVFSCNGEASMWKSGEARQTNCKLHLSINCKRPKVATVSGWNFLKQLKEKDSQITESNFIPLD